MATTVAQPIVKLPRVLSIGIGFLPFINKESLNWLKFNFIRVIVSQRSQLSKGLASSDVMVAPTTILNSFCKFDSYNFVLVKTAHGASILTQKYIICLWWGMPFLLFRVENFAHKTKKKLYKCQKFHFRQRFDRFSSTGIKQRRSPRGQLEFDQNFAF